MEDLKKLSVHELAMKLNMIIKAKSNNHITGLELIAMDYMWNSVVMELWERIPSLKNDPDIQPVLTNIKDAIAYNEEHPIKIRKLEQDK